MEVLPFTTASVWSFLRCSHLHAMCFLIHPYLPVVKEGGVLQLGLYLPDFTAVHARYDCFSLLLSAGLYFKRKN